ncbi:polysulfide reductase NrfD [candidate division KSB1 bacterium]|nr:polysulfide reductase NrfD [bacterium]NUM66537.1 polysulfide reductase NrfD [candidate division KSB1 bacterium]
MDKHLIPRGVQRSPFWQFLLWMAPWAMVLAVGLYAMYLCFAVGLNQTNMDNRFAFGLWIYLDLTVIALGAGAFFTGFLLYLLRRDELKAVINSAVVLGFICYSGAIVVLMVDVGQPLRAWFTFWHPNVHSMLTEVTFCLTCYLVVLAIEYAPIVLKNRKIRQIPSFLVFEFELHKLMYVFAGVGTFLSFFHQGSLGGLYGVLRGRPFAFREAIGIWPSTFFLFILSAAAVGPSFIMLTTWLVSKLSKKTLVKPEVFRLLAKVSGALLIVYVLFKAVDTLIWINSTSPGAGFPAFEYYSRREFGTWILFTEIVVLGLVPALMLLYRRRHHSMPWLISAAFLACAGVALNRFVMTIQTLALPTLPFDAFLSYVPSWQEVATFMAIVAYGVLVYSLSFRYLSLFPQERELNYAHAGAPENGRTSRWFAFADRNRAARVPAGQW